MNKREVIAKVALESRVREEICVHVIDTLEEVLTQEINRPGGWRKIFDTVYNLMTRMRDSRNKSNNE